MSLTVRGRRGDLHDFFYGDDVTVADIKRKLAALEGAPAEQLVLVHAGRTLEDGASLAEYGLADFNRAGEAFIDLQVSMPEPVHIYLASPVARGAPICECLERAAELRDVLPLLEAHGVCGGVARDCSVFAKRGDGTAIAAALELGDSLASAGDKIAAALGEQRVSMVFVPATDGNLHVVAGPARTLDTPAASPFLRSAAPQPRMPVKQGGATLAELQRELCI